jgi:hypothetical protein
MRRAHREEKRDNGMQHKAKALECFAVMIRATSAPLFIGLAGASFGLTEREPMHSERPARPAAVKASADGALRAARRSLRR